MPKSDKGKHQKPNYRYRAFAEAYVSNGFNATQAAITAKYSEKTAYSQGSRLLKNVEVQTLISEIMTQRTMSKTETAWRLSEHARADIRPFINLNSDELRQHPQAWLIKKMKQTKRKIDSLVIEERMEIELYDAQSALTTFARHHGLLKDGVTINVNMDLVSQMIRALEDAGLDPSETIEKMIMKAQARVSQPD